VSEEERMDSHWAYCSACDRQVEIAVRPGRETDPSTGAAIDEIVCLEIGHSCTGALCPITDVPPDEMRKALQRDRPDPETSKPGD
jgi:hypothetical protein